MIVHGKIVDAGPQGLTIHIPYHPHFVTKQWDEVAVDIPDGRRISPEQRRKIYALMGEIADWAGMATEEVKLTLKHQFITRHLEGLHKELFSLADCDMTTARLFISYLIDFVLEFDVPLHVPLITLCDDIEKAVYSCLMHRKCIICGKKADVHHWRRLGMGADREHVIHEGMPMEPLCRNHHDECHTMAQEEFDELYHIVPVAATKEICKRLGLRHNAS